jgi:hypothetical protein
MLCARAGERLATVRIKATLDATMVCHRGPTCGYSRFTMSGTLDARISLLDFPRCCCLRECVAIAKSLASHSSSRVRACVVLPEIGRGRKRTRSVIGSAARSSRYAAAGIFKFGSNSGCFAIESPSQPSRKRRVPQARNFNAQHVAWASLRSKKRTSSSAFAAGLGLRCFTPVAK